MVNSLYLIVVVLFRTTGVVIILHSVYSALAAIAVGALFSDGRSTSLLALPALVLPVLAGLALRLLAKPVARLVTSNL